MQVVDSKGTLMYSLGGLGWGASHMRQFNADMGLDWMGIHVSASNNYPSKPYTYLHLN
jgi:hypothetical protein